MTDFRIAAGREAAGGAGSASLVQVLINGAGDVARRFDLVASNLPYRATDVELASDSVPEMTRAVAAATWKRIGDEVPSYAFAENLGRRHRESGAPLEALLLYWLVLRRAIHLVLAERKIRTGEGDRDLLRHATLMDYTIDWATEASVVGYVMSKDAGS